MGKLKYSVHIRYYNYYYYYLCFAKKDPWIWGRKNLPISFKVRLEAQCGSFDKYHSSSTELISLLHLLFFPFTSPSGFRKNWCISKTLPRFTAHSTEMHPCGLSRAAHTVGASCQFQLVRPSFRCHLVLCFELILLETDQLRQWSISFCQPGLLLLFIWHGENPTGDLSL